MKKFCLSLIFIVSFSFSVFAVEWGGLINNVSKVGTGDFTSLDGFQSNGISLWLNGAFTKDKSLRFAGEISYKYNLPYAVPSKKVATMTHIVDLNMLKLSGQWTLAGSSLGLNLGRFSYSESTGAIFSQTSDGINLKYTTFEWNLDFYAGYTGLLNSFTVAMSDNISKKMDHIYNLSYGYIPLNLAFTLSNLNLHSIGIQASGFIDTTENKAHKAYGSLIFKGPLANIGRYSLVASVGTEKFKSLMLYGNVDLSFYVGQSFLIGIGAEYASGDNEIFSTFKSISAKNVSQSTSVEYGADVIVPRLTAVYIFDKVVINLSEKLTLSIPKNGFTLNGLNSNLGVIYSMFSDLKLGCSVSAYNDLTFKDKKPFNISATLTANFTF